MSDLAFEDWKNRARSYDVRDVAERLGATLKKTTVVEFAGPCPRCGGADKFSINTRKNVFMCRGSGGGDAIQMVEHVKGLDFIEACEWLIGEPPPGRDKREISEEERRLRQEQRDIEDAEREAARAEREASERRHAESILDRCRAIFESARPLHGTHAADYLANRGIPFSTRWTTDLRFVPSMLYRGFPDEKSDGEVDLGSFPAMVGAIRNPDRELIGLHRTFLDPVEPIKLRPPGDQRRNSAKKVVGTARGGVILLADPGADRALLGEGIETTFSADLLGIGRAGEADADPMMLLAGLSLVNISGRCTGSVPHPTIKRRAIINAEPDFDDPGIVLPPSIERVILLGDGDSEAVETRARLLTGARRFKAQGKEPFICMAPDATDFNKVLTGR